MVSTEARARPGERIARAAAVLKMVFIGIPFCFSFLSPGNTKNLLISKACVILGLPIILDLVYRIK
jgi:hypothetical protein